MDEFFSGAEARMVRPLPTLIPRCGQCGLIPKCNTPRMPVSGDGRRGIMLVGEHPTAEDDRAGELGWGRLESELERVGIDMLRDCWLTTATLCHSKTIDTHKTAISDCRPNLLRAIADRNPHTVVLLGAAAVKSLVGFLWKNDVGELRAWVGHNIPAHKPNVWVCPVYNPNDVPHPKRPVELVHFREHLRAAVGHTGPPWPDGPPDYARAVRTISDATTAARWLSRIDSGVIAFDFETNMLKPDAERAEIVCCSVCWDGRETIAFPWYGDARGAMCALLENPDVAKIGANIKFESRWCMSYLGLRVRGWMWDTMLGAHVLDPRGDITSVKFQAFVRLGAPQYNAHIEPYLGSVEPGCNSVNRIREIKPELLLHYCGVDSVLEFHLAQHQMAEMGI